MVFHERYWKDVSKEAKDFIMSLLKPSPQHRVTSQQALQDPWIAGQGATDHNLLPEIKAYMARARLKRGVELVKLANRIEALRMQEDEEDELPQEHDIPSDPLFAADKAMSRNDSCELSSPKTPTGEEPGSAKRKLSKLAKSAIFREVVLAKVREIQAEEEQRKTISEAAEKGATH